MPDGLEDVSKVPNVVAELLRRGWSETDVKSALGNNLLRVLREAEKVGWRRTQTQVSGRKKKNAFVQKHPHQYPSLSHREARHHTDLDILSFEQITDNAFCISVQVSKCSQSDVHPDGRLLWSYTHISGEKIKEKKKRKKEPQRKNIYFGLHLGSITTFSLCLRGILKPGSKVYRTSQVVNGNAGILSGRWRSQLAMASWAQEPARS